MLTVADGSTKPSTSTKLSLNIWAPKNARDSNYMGQIGEAALSGARRSTLAIVMTAEFQVCCGNEVPTDRRRGRSASNSHQKQLLQRKQPDQMIGLLFSIWNRLKPELFRFGFNKFCRRSRFLGRSFEVKLFHITDFLRLNRNRVRAFEQSLQQVF